MFRPEDRDRVHDYVVGMASSDARVVGGAVLGSLAHGEGDRWSDLDLMFAVAEGVPVAEVLRDWTRRLADDFDAVALFDLQAGAATYRVLLLPGCLQLDLSFAPAADFGAAGPNFRLLFGSAVDRPHGSPPSPDRLFGFAVHHALRARFCIERGRHWQAEYWISGVRNHALGLACRSRGLDTSYGRGFDQLPGPVLAAFEGSIVRSLEPAELRRSLAVAIEVLLKESGEAADLARRVEPQLRELAEPSDS
jgi:predicted nucleotidyltransferase